MEACNAKRLEFFEKDAIDWSQGEGCDYAALVKELIAFRKANPALENGKWGARMHQVVTDRPQEVLAWARQEEGHKVVGLFNFSGSEVTAKLADGLAAGTYDEFRGTDKVTLKAGDSVTLPAWGFRLLSTKGE